MFLETLYEYIETIEKVKPNQLENISLIFKLITSIFIKY